MINNPRIGITGASGHIGSAITRHLTDQGFQVVAFTRNTVLLKNVVARKYDLTSRIPGDLFSDIDVLIHCAYITSDQSADAGVVNYEGSRQLFDACKKQGVKKIVFFSSVTAHANAQSDYARSKFAIEQLLQKNTDFIIHCSMVIGNGGVFQRILSYATTHAFIPVIGSGTQIIQVVAIDDVASFVEQVITRDLNGSGVLANSEELNYKQFFSCIARVYRKKIFFIPVPASLLKLMVRSLRLLNIRTAAAEENIVGIQTLKKRDPMLLLPSYRTFRNKLEELRDSRHR